MSTTHYNPDSIEGCLEAYRQKKKGNEIIANYDDATTYTLEELWKQEDGSIPEAIQIFFGRKGDRTRQIFIEGVGLTEFDPGTPGGYSFWTSVLEAEDLSKKIAEDPDGVVTGQWDTLRQVLNMGQIAFMAKYNGAMAYYRRYHNKRQALRDIEHIMGKWYRDYIEESANQEEVENGTTESDSTD